MYIYPTIMETNQYGKLVCRVFNQYKDPIPNSVVTIKEFTPPESILYEILTNESGKTAIVDLPAPPIQYSLEPESPKPYSEYILTITAPDYMPVVIIGVQILTNELAIQDICLDKTKNRNIEIAPHTFYAEYPPKIPETEIKEYAEQPDFRKFNNLCIPQTIIVHDGLPNDSAAPNYTVNYTDYIKNVVSSEIYATWPQSAIEANVLVILSFALNRFYTKWYAKKGKNFTITSSSAYDQNWSYGRNIYQNISDIVDDLFPSYLTIPYFKQPLFSQYCDGIRFQCPDWLMQWESKSLSEQGNNALKILNYFYRQPITIKNVL